MGGSAEARRVRTSELEVVAEGSRSKGASSQHSVGGKAPEWVNLARVQTLHVAQLVKKHKKGIHLCFARPQSRNTETLLGLEWCLSCLDPAILNS